MSAFYLLSACFLPSSHSRLVAGRGATQLGEERSLQPWDGEEFSNGDAPGDSLDQLDQLDNRSNGWDANDMFRKNEQDYGVQSTFDHNLSGYTMQLQKKDTPEFRLPSLSGEIGAASRFRRC